MGHLSGRRRAAVVTGVLVTAMGAALAPSYADAPWVVDRTGTPDFGWSHTGCSSSDELPGDLPVPVEGPSGVPNGAGSLQISATDDTYAEFDLPNLQQAADLTSYRVTAASPDGVIHVVAAIQPSGGSSTFLTASVPVPAYSWQTIDLTTIEFDHYASNHPVFWGETPDDSGTLAHFVAGAPGVDFRPAVDVLGCDADGGIGRRTLYLDLSDIATADAEEPYAGIIDHEPTTAPTPQIATTAPRTITAGQRTDLTSRFTYAFDYPMAQKPWSIESATPGTENWQLLGMNTTTSDGAAVMSVRPKVNRSYRWVYETDDPVTFLAAVSDRVELIVRSRVSAKLVDSKVSRGHMLQVRGLVTPSPPGGVSVTLWRWGAKHTRLETADVAEDGSFMVATRAGRTGTWPLLVSIPATPTNAAGRSSVMKARVTR